MGLTDNGQPRECPFCGERTVEITQRIACGTLVTMATYGVQCLGCGAKGPEKATEAGAVAGWNTRAKDARR